MDYLTKTKEELIIELHELEQKYHSLKDMYDADLTKHQQSEYALDKMGSPSKTSTWVNNEINSKNTFSKEVNHFALVSLIENSNDIAIVKDNNRRIVSGNGNFVSATGRTLISELIGMTDAEIMNISENDEPAYSYMLDDIKALGLKQGEILVREEKVTFPKGEIRTTLTKKFPIYLDGEVRGLGVITTDITDRKIADDTLLERNLFIESLINTAPGILYIYDLVEKKNIFTNDGITKILGYSVEVIKQMGSQLISTLMHPDDFIDYVKKILPLYAQAKDGEQIVNQCRLKDSKGNWCWIEFKEIIYKRLDDGTPQQIFGMGIDISNRKQVELLLKEKTDEIEAQIEEYLQLNEELSQTNKELQIAKEKAEYNIKLLQNIADNIPAFIAEVDATTLKYKFVNKKFSTSFYKKREEIIGSHISDVIGKANADFAMKYIDEVRNGNTSTYINTFDMKEGKRYINVQYVPGFDKNGKVDNIIVLSTDITNIKEAEQELKLAKEQAEESEQKYKQIFDNTFDIMAVYEVTDDNRFKVITFNSAEAKLIGSLENYQNRFIDECIPPELYNQFKQNYERCIKEEKLINYEEDIVFQNINSSFQTQLIPIKNNNGRIHRIIVISRDITENKLLNNQLKNQNEELKTLNLSLTIAKDHAEESDRLKTSFLQNMSHEIRTPMNAIMGFSSLLKNEYNNKEKVEKFSEIINRRCVDLLDIINDILDISKIESGQLPVNIEECNLNELYAELTTFFEEHKQRIGKNNIDLHLHCACKTCGGTILTDMVKLKQIFINLINNAFKFTNEGSIEGGCKYDDNNNMVFYVSDTGIGIPSDKQAFVFERFTQLHQGEIKNIGGTGLGLPIVKALVNLLGGTIILESEPNKGSTFSFTIPYKLAQPAHPKANISTKLNTISFANKTILIVEDDPFNAIYLQEVLSGINLNILIAENGKQAIDLSLSQPVDMVLMDIRLPDMNGYEATKKILQLKPNLKIIAQTAYAAQDEKQKALNVGCVDYISKPTSKILLLSLIYKYL